MGLPPGMQHSELDDLSADFDRLRHIDAGALVPMVEDPCTEFRLRFVAGQLLALLGDPRISPLAPPMIQVPGAQAKLGLPRDRVAHVVADYAAYGVKREWIEKETPQYTVRLETFSLAKYCVTNREYLEFLLESGHCGLPTSWRLGVYPHWLANHPVYSVSPADAEAYIGWLNEKTGRRFRLPTEAEWEYAAAGSEGREFPWGNDFLPDRCNTAETGILQTTAVGMFPAGAGPFGHPDLAGNVEELVADEYRAYEGGEWINDDLAARTGTYRVTRGGGFTRFRDLARTRRRHGWFESELYAIGFRLAETAS